MPQRAVEKQYYKMPELVGFQSMEILDPNGMTFDAVGVFDLVFQLLFKSASSYCERSVNFRMNFWCLKFFKKNLTNCCQRI